MQGLQGLKGKLGLRRLPHLQVFRTEIISRRLNKSATLPLMSAALTTVAGIMAVAAAATHPNVSLLMASAGSFCRQHC